MYLATKISYIQVYGFIAKSVKPKSCSQTGSKKVITTLGDIVNSEGTVFEVGSLSKILINFQYPKLPYCQITCNKIH